MLCSLIVFGVTSRPEPEAASPPPRWVSLWIAALPAAYILSPLALLCLPWLRRLPRMAWWILGFYALGQQIPALFTPEPLLASLLALVRTLMMFALIGLGAALGSSRDLRLMAVGLGVTFLIALVFTITANSDLLAQRLSHPYMTSVSLGLAGAVGIWLALLAPGRLLWRVPLGLGALAVLLLAGSRGPSAAALVGLLVAFAFYRDRRMVWGLVLGAGLLVGGLYAGNRLGASAVNRLFNADSTGRTAIWSKTLETISSEPWSGVGSYRLGTRLRSVDETCTLFPVPGVSAPTCPGWAAHLESPWLIAHNISLQQWAEAGPLGLVSLFALLGVVAMASIQGRDPLSLAIVSGLLVSTAVDNTLLVPSPFFAELFWVVAGVQLARVRTIHAGTGALAAGLMLALSYPLLLLIRPGVSPPTPDVVFLSTPYTSVNARPYQVIAQFRGLSGQYRASLQSCLEQCLPVSDVLFTIDHNRSPVLKLSGQLKAVAQQRLELRLYQNRWKGGLIPLATHRWTVETSR